ncbi:APC family permease [Pseudonocardia sp. TRM90224]|uniref:APC family permease n=1 Tax=Pseudonocardia sp. TRM90224 TaxID=2812678 RepID=UPI001E50CF14|nr:APC family permease [Pseudonocardia sp. TRM90224]
MARPPQVGVVQDDVHEKGLSGGSVGLWGSVTLGVSSVAPAYALTATLGILAAAVAVKMPAVIVAGFIPMFLTAYAYRELNRAIPDCGTSFTWATKAFGTYVGWMCGWGAIIATVIVLSNLAGVAVSFFYLFIARITGIESIAELAADKIVNIVTCVAFVAAATFVAYRGITTTKRVQVALVVFQMVVLAMFVIAAFAGATASPTAIAFEWDWFNPFTGLTLTAFTAGLIGSIFAFWGWDTCLTVNEESTDLDRTPGRAAVVTVVLILVSYLLVGIAAMVYAGVGTDGLGLGNEETSDNVFGALAEPVLGPWASMLLFLAVLASSAASLQTTFLPPARTLLAMGVYRAVPARFARIHPRFLIPSYATLACGIGTAVFYSLLTLLSESVLSDTILTLGIMICFYYGLTAFACVWYFRKELFRNRFNFVFKFLFPLLGAVMLTVVFVISMIDSYDPANGSGAAVGGVGLVFVLALGLLVLGAGLMVIQRVRDPEFFIGGTLRRDTPALIVPE